MRHERPSGHGEARSSALWGKGSGGQSRGSALWGRGGRGIALLAVLVSVVIPAAGFAGHDDNVRAAVPSDLISAAQANENATFAVIVQGEARGNSNQLAEGIRNEVSSAKGNGMGRFKHVYRSINGVSLEVSGKELQKLAKHPHVTSITRDEAVPLAGLSWRDAIGVSSLWDLSAITCAVNAFGIQIDPLCKPRAAQPAPQAPAIAIVDSGIDASKASDFGSRVVARANLSSHEPNAPGDPLGHGTMVAGIAAGSNPELRGVATNAPLVDVRVASSKGEALTSDIVAAADWILANKAQHNIRVANFSLAGTSEASFRFHPIDRAVEKLWLNGVVVVAAAGNHGSATGPVKIPAPANDPFVITVGALGMNGTAARWDDFRAPWSAYGATADGFMKPDMSAPGRYMTAPVPAGSTLALARPERVVAPGYMWMSGTSFAAPLVSGVAAQILARRPGFTPDQVKGALMASTHYLPMQDPGAGVGELNASAAINIASPPNPNQNLYQFVADGTFNADAWADHVSTSSNWTASNWTASNWVSSNWTASNWVASNWTASNWVSSNWTASNWVASNWTVAADEE
jgi:serine protease AprX